MDDLESFFYVLCWICCGYDGPGKRIKDFASTFSKWEDRRPKEGASDKISLFYLYFRDQTDLTVTDYFGDIFLTLVDSLHKFFRHYLTLSDALGGVKPAPPTLETALGAILPLVNAAIASVEAEEAAESPASPTPDDALPATPPDPQDPQFTLMKPPRVYHSRASKRTHAESSDGESSASTTAKKSRKKTNAPYQRSSLHSSSLATDEP